jgi:hypothetical protein
LHLASPHHLPFNFADLLTSFAILWQSFLPFQIWALHSITIH